jgi:hypothetical protein
MDFKSKIKLPEVTSLPTPSSDTEGDVLKKGDSVYICRDSRWRKIYPPVNWGIDVPRLCGLTPQYIVWPRSSTTASITPGNTRTFYVPIVVPYGCVVSAITINVTTAASSGTNTLGIYDSRHLNNYYYPYNLLRSGSVAVNSTGFKTVTFGTSLELQSGELYFLALNNPLSTSYNITCLSNTASAIGQYFGDTTNSLAPWCIIRSESALSNPAPTSGYLTSTVMPLFTLTLSDIFLY